MMDCIIVANEADSKHLGEFVSKCSSLKLVNIYNDRDSALKEISGRHDIDLAFVDIEMVGSDKLDFINRLNNPPVFVALSTNGEYAVKAFDYNFIDYLVTPLSFSRFFKAVDKTIRYNYHREISNAEENEIFVKSGSTLVRLNLKDITYIEALKNYIIINTVDKKFTIHFTMKSIENELSPDLFIRVHKSYIVNKRLINNIDESFLQIELGEKMKDLPIGKSYKNLILNDINVMCR
jgi:DNA-binding LytR/AlgR family response regulator